MSTQRIFLVGPMGAGKTTLGTLISEKVSWPYIDNDAQMALLSGMSADELSHLPIDRLHELEGNYLKQLVDRSGPYIAGVAASVADYPESLELLRNETMIYLFLPLSQLKERAGTTGVGRQALTDDADRVITERFNRRDPIYRSISQMVVELSDDPHSDSLRICESLNLT